MQWGLALNWCTNDCIKFVNKTCLNLMMCHFSPTIIPIHVTQVKKSGRIPPIPPGIPTGILEPPTWDPTLNPRRDPAKSHLGSRPGFWNLPGGGPPIPPRIPALFHAKSRLATYVCPRWNPTWEIRICTTWDPKWDPAISLGVTCFWPKQDPIYWVF